MIAPRLVTEVGRCRGDDPADAAAVREIDLQKRFHMSATRLAELLKLTLPKSHALRQHLGIDKDKDCMHVFKFGSSKHPRFSDTALKRMREALAAAKPEPSTVLDNIYSPHVAPTSAALRAYVDDERAGISWIDWWEPTNLLTMAMMTPEFHVA